MNNQLKTILTFFLILAAATAAAGEARRNIP